MFHNHINSPSYVIFTKKKTQHEYISLGFKQILRCVAHVVYLFAEDAGRT